MRIRTCIRCLEMGVPPATPLAPRPYVLLLGGTLWMGVHILCVGTRLEVMLTDDMR